MFILQARHLDPDWNRRVKENIFSGLDIIMQKRVNETVPWCIIYDVLKLFPDMRVILPSYFLWMLSRAKDTFRAWGMGL